METEQPIIEIKNLVRDFGGGRGVFDVSFKIYKGECFGFLGPNGAGKSTTIRHLMGFARPDSGETFINGISSQKYPSLVMSKVSYIPGEISLPNNLTGKEYISEMLELKRVSSLDYLNYLTDLFQLDPSLLCKEMSLGMKRKIAIVTAFMSNPDIIIMDEPSSGLDIQMQEVFINLVKEEIKRGKTILMSSHIFHEIDSCCQKIAVIKDGKIVSLIDSSELKHPTNKQYVINFSSKKDKEEFLSDKNKFYKLLNNDKKSNLLDISIQEKNTEKLIKHLSKYNISDFQQIKETLEDYFMSFYKEDKEFKGV